MRASEIFNDVLPARLTTSKKVFAGDSLRGKCVSIELDGEAGGRWTLAVDDDGQAHVADGLNPASDCHIQMKDSTFEGLIQGKVNVPMAVLTRKIKIKGEATLAAKLGLALQKLLEK